jgi:hypothetical protein
MEVKMGIYEPLARYLSALNDDSWTASFDQIESKLGFGLPPSARKYRQWWSNEQGKGHSQKEGWQSVGWETSDVDLADMRVQFRRQRRRSSRAVAPEKPVGPTSELWDKASRLSGINNRDALIEAALTALIRREAAKQLIAMGGTMPDFAVPPRERPTW